MSDYKRDIYYLYNYENAQKRNNVGFTRVELMNGKCRMTSRIRVPSMNGKTLKVCLFIRKQGKMQFLPVGMMKISNMTGESRVLLDAENIMEMGYCLEEMKGMVIYDSPQKFFGSEWDDQRICFEEFKLAEEKKDIILEPFEESPEEFHAELPEAESTKAEVTVWRENKNKELTAASIDDAFYENEAHGDRNENVQGMKEHVPDVNTALENKTEKKDTSVLWKTEKTGAACQDATENKIKKERSEETSKHRLPEVFYQFPSMCPFEDDEMTDCVRIEPQDIGRLPMESWILANNSFLLHSYYSYRHLLLARRNCDSGYEYVLCVPGICQSREQFMAAMFGFSDFKPVKKVEDNTGEFGYWYMPVLMGE